MATMCAKYSTCDKRRCTNRQIWKT